MKVLGVVGSPRTQGNTQILMDAALEPIASEGIDVQRISLAGLHLLPCMDCGTCTEIEDCPQDDDLWLLYESLKSAQGIILASPVYFGGVTPSVKALMDRAGFIARNNGHPLLGKVGGPLAVGNRAGHLMALSQMLLWFNYMGIIIPGAPYWATGSGREPGEVFKDQEALRRARLFGSHMAHLLKSLAPALSREAAS